MADITLRTLSQLVEHAADQFGDQIPIEDGATRLTYTQLNAARRRSAAACVAPSSIAI